MLLLIELKGAEITAMNRKDVTVTSEEFVVCVPKVAVSIGSSTLGLIPRRKSRRGFPAKG
jgi:hypothetical protein